MAAPRSDAASVQGREELVRQLQKEPIESSLIGAQERAESERLRAEKTAEQKLREASLTERFLLGASTTFSPRGVDFLGAGIAGIRSRSERERAREIMKERLVEAQLEPKKEFVAKTATGSILGSPTGVIGASMIGGAGLRAAGRLASRAPKIGAGLKVIGVGVGGFILGERGARSFRAVKEGKPGVAVSEVIRTGSELGGGFIGIKPPAQSPRITAIRGQGLEIGRTRVLAEATSKTARVEKGFFGGKKIIPESATFSRIAFRTPEALAGRQPAPSGSIGVTTTIGIKGEAVSGIVIAKQIGFTRSKRSMTYGMSKLVTREKTLKSAERIGSVAIGKMRQTGTVTLERPGMRIKAPATIYRRLISVAGEHAGKGGRGVIGGRFQLSRVKPVREFGLGGRPAKPSGTRTATGIFPSREAVDLAQIAKPFIDMPKSSKIALIPRLRISPDARSQISRPAAQTRPMSITEPSQRFEEMTKLGGVFPILKTDTEMERVVKTRPGEALKTFPYQASKRGVGLIIGQKQAPKQTQRQTPKQKLVAPPRTNLPFMPPRKAPMILLPSFPLPKFRGISGKVSGISLPKLGRAFRYTPSVSAIGLKIKAFKIPKGVRTGLSIRPVIIPAMGRKKRRR